MATITITTDQGEIVKIIKNAEAYNLNKQVARAVLIEEIEDAINRAREKEKEHG